MSPRPIELPESGFEEALRLAREGRYSDAVESLEVALESSDREASANAAVVALGEIARLAESALELGAAERALELAAVLRPRYPDLHHRLACVQLARHKRGDARRSLGKALAINPRFLAARLELALLDAREGLVGESLEALRAMGKEAPLKDPGAFQQGLRRLERAEWEDAEPLLKRALEIADPRLKEAIDRFRDHLERGEAARAAQILQDLLPRHETYPDVQYLIGLAELQLGHYDDALDSLARALELNPDFHEARIQLAQAFEALGESAQAMEQLALVLEHDPENRMAAELEAAWSARGVKDRRARKRAAARGREGPDANPTRGTRTGT